MIDDDQGGDPACWLANVCADCGLLVESALPATCPRCGALVGRDPLDIAARVRPAPKGADLPGEGSGPA